MRLQKAKAAQSRLRYPIAIASDCTVFAVAVFPDYLHPYPVTNTSLHKQQDCREAKLKKLLPRELVAELEAGDLDGGSCIPQESLLAACRLLLG